MPPTTTRGRSPQSLALLSLAPQICSLLLWVLTLGGCAHPLTPLPAGPELRGWTHAVDWKSAGNEVAGVLSGYLQVDTMNPPGNETRGARYLAALLAREGIPSRIVEHAPGRGSLIARVKGSGKQKPFCLLSHIDVVPAKARTEWPKGKGPLSGAIDQEYVWGRGALDMKGMGAIEVMTLIWLKRLKVPLNRDVVLLAVADEEIDNKGMKHLVKRHWKEIGCSHLINEGSIGVKDLLSKGQSVFAISVAEKSVLWVKMTVRGRGGHGSTPVPGNTPERLLDALRKIMARKPKPKIDRSLTELLARAGEQQGGFSGFVLKRPSLVRVFVRGKLMKNPVTRAAITNTVNLTNIDTGQNEPNVVPSSAHAIFDCRLLPGTRPASVLGELRELVGPDPGIRFEVIANEPSGYSSWDDPLFFALSRQLRQGRKDVAVGPALSVGFTDSIYARRKGVRAYGMVPFEVPKEELASMHGPKERVSLRNLREGLRILFAVTLEVSADAAKLSPARPAAQAAPFQRITAAEMAAIRASQPTSRP